jgi:NADH-quinone oxidoreductase subunit L
MAGLVLSGSLFFLFLFWEMTALCSYALIAFDNDNPQAVRGGLKALLITQLGGVGLLIGVLVVNGWLGTFDIR